MNEKFNKSTFPKVPQTWKHKEAQLRVQFQTEELTMTYVKENFLQKNQKARRRPQKNAQEIAAIPQSEVSKARTACDS